MTHTLLSLTSAATTIHPVVLSILGLIGALLLAGVAVRLARSAPRGRGGHGLRPVGGSSMRRRLVTALGILLVLAGPPHESLFPLTLGAISLLGLVLASSLLASVLRGYMPALRKVGAILSLLTMLGLGGQGLLLSFSQPAPVEASGSGNSAGKAIPIAAGYYHSLALKPDGTVSAWGWNATAQLGNYSSGICGTWAEPCSQTPIPVLGPGGSGYLTGVAAVAAGEGHSLALKNDGTVWAWGRNTNGELGATTSGTCGTVPCSRSPLQVVGPGGSGFLTGVIAISAGNNFSLALKGDGTVWAWGASGSGQLGTTSSDTCSGNPCSRAPVQVAGPGGSGYLSGVTAIETGSVQSLALKGDGTVWAWGATATANSARARPPPPARLPHRCWALAGLASLLE